MIDREENPYFLNEFLDYTASILLKSENSVKEYNYDLANFLKYMCYHFKYSNEEEIKSISIKEMPVEILQKIQLPDIHSYLAYLRTRYRSKPATLARKSSSIRIFFSFLTKKAKILTVNPAQDLETPKLDRRLPKYLTLEESEHLLDTTAEDTRNSTRNYAIITLFLNCGMRLSELVGINISDIDFTNNKLNVIGKGNKERTIYLNDACVEAVNDYLRERPKDKVEASSKDALFLSEQRKRISNRTVQYVVDSEIKKAGLDTKKYSVHKLRHTAATLMYKHGHVDIRALQELLGHESISTTEIYTHVDNDQIRSAVNRNPLAKKHK